MKQHGNVKCVCDSEESYSVLSLSRHSLLSIILGRGRQQPVEEKPSIRFLLSTHSERLAGEHGGACRGLRHHTHTHTHTQQAAGKSALADITAVMWGRLFASSMLRVGGRRPLLAARCSSSCVAAPKEPLEANKGANVIKGFTLTEQPHTSGSEPLRSLQNDALTASMFLFLSPFP